MKRGFTLVEMIAIITVMGIIILFVVPIVSNKVKESRNEKFKEDARTIIKSVEIYMEQENILTLPFEGLDITKLDLDLMNLNNYQGIVRYINDEIVLETLTKEKLCGYGTKQEFIVNNLDSNDCNYTKEIKE